MIISLWKGYAMHIGCVSIIVSIIDKLIQIKLSLWSRTTGLLHSSISHTHNSLVQDISIDYNYYTT